MIAARRLAQAILIGTLAFPSWASAAEEVPAQAGTPPAAPSPTAPSPATAASSLWPAGTELSFGAGAVENPRYLGARRTDLSPAPYISGTIGPDLAVDTQDGIRYTALRFGDFSAGPITRYRFGRDSRSLPAHLRGLDGVKDAVELGAFATYESGPFSLDLIGTEDVEHGHRGAILEAHAALTVPFGDPAGQQGVALGPFVKGANHAFLQKNLGVTASQAAATGLAPFAPDAGLAMAGMEVNGAITLVGRWSLRGFANWGRLVGDAAKSPLVEDGGSRNQISSGLFLVFTP